MLTVITDEFACDLDQIQYVYVGSANAVIQTNNGNTIVVTREVGKATIDKMVKAAIDKPQDTKVSCCDNEDEINADKEPYRMGDVLDPVEYQAALEGCGLRTGLGAESPVEVRAEPDEFGWIDAKHCKPGKWYVTIGGYNVFCVRSGTSDTQPLFLAEHFTAESSPIHYHSDHRMRLAEDQSW